MGCQDRDEWGQNPNQKKDNQDHGFIFMPGIECKIGRQTRANCPYHQGNDAQQIKRQNFFQNRLIFVAEAVNRIHISTL